MYRVCSRLASPPRPDEVLPPARVAEWQTQRTQNPSRATSCEFDSRLGHSPTLSIAVIPSPDNIKAPSTRDRMLQPLVRSVMSAVVAACFALGAITWGAMPACPAGSNAQHASAHGQESSHGHSHGAELPGAVHCPHLCCANLATPLVSTVAAGRLVAEYQNPGLAARTVAQVSRPPHSLPFAHGPPHSTV